MIGVVASVKGCRLGCSKGLGVQSPTGIFFAKLWMFGEQAKADQEVCLTAPLACFRWNTA